MTFHFHNWHFGNWLPGGFDMAPPPGRPPRRPLLVARWKLGPDGRLTCRWVRQPALPN